MSSGKAKTLLWGVELEPKDVTLERRAVVALKQLVGDMEIRPVHIMSSGSYRVDLDPLQKQLNQRLSSYKGLNLQPARVIDVESLSGLSERDKVEALLEIARIETVEALFVMTHARKGLSRWVMGSFAESLLLSAKFPVLVCNPQVEVHPQMQTILWPTDLIEDDDDVLNMALARAKAYSPTAQIIALHQIQRPEVPYGGHYGGLMSRLFEEFVESRERANHIMERWQRYAKEHHVVLEPLIDTRVEKPSEAILRQAKSVGADLIWMPTYVRPATAAVVGSTARQVVRGSHVPVWVQHFSRRKSQGEPRSQIIRDEELGRPSPPA